MRIGQGYDVHRLVAERPLILGGIEIPYEKGLLGHSDADVLLHAISDALLGAAALGDIGAHFPDSDPAYRGADSAELLRAVGDLIRAAGYEIGNIDSTVVCQAPRAMKSETLTARWSARHRNSRRTSLRCGRGLRRCSRSRWGL